MPKIKTYPLVPSLTVDTKMVATRPGGMPADETYNVSTQQIINMVARNSVFTGSMSLLAYDDDAAAAAAGLATGKLFQTTGAGAAPLNAAGIVMVKQ